MFKEFTVNQNARLDHALRQDSGFSVRQAKGLIKEGAIRVNGHCVKKPAFSVRPGDHVVFDTSPLEKSVPSNSSEKETRESGHGLDIVYEDADLLALNKPSGILSVPTSHSPEKSMQDFASLYLGEKQPRRKPFAVHRLDREASGVLLFAKSIGIREALMEQFKKQKIKKSYLAIVEMAHSNADPEGDIQIALDDNRPHSRVIIGQGKPALTHYQILKQSPPHAWVRASTFTGRRHQVRVHLAQALGALVGDRFYGNPVHEKLRLMLHGEKIVLHHPTGGKELMIQAELPSDFRI